MKDGSLVRISSHPLTSPISSDTARATPTPTQTLSAKYQLNIEAVRAEVITATPVERSNSPPIISSDTPTTMIPIVEAP